jgi:2-methylfumaryl-CoA isomerase
MVSLLGDRHGRPAVDYTVNPAVGFPTATGPEGSSEPVAHVLPAWDCIAGQMVALGLLAGERHRLRHGGGQSVEISLKDVAAAMLGNLGIIAEVEINGVDRPKTGNSLYGAYGQDFVCSDGHRVMVVALTRRQWAVLLEVTGLASEMAALARRLEVDLRDEAARFAARADITAILAPWFAARTASEVGAQLEAAGATWSRFRSFAEAVHEDPDFSTENPLFHRIDQPGIGPYTTPASPFAFGALDRDPPRPAPLLGEHTEAILADVLGLGSRQIGALMDDGVVAGPRPA